MTAAGSRSRLAAAGSTCISSCLMAWWRCRGLSWGTDVERRRGRLVAGRSRPRSTMSGAISNRGAVELLERYRTADASARARLLRESPPTAAQVNEIVEAAAAQTWVDAREALAISETAW